MNIGFVGAGLMGHGMASNLLTAGHAVSVIVHRNRTPIEDLVSKGAVEAKTSAELARDAEVIVLCVTGTAAACEAIEVLLPNLTAGMMVLDTTTHDPEGPERLAEVLAPMGVDYVEAPVTGGVQQARDGVLGGIVGCEEAAFERARQVLSCFCQQIEHFGPVGSAVRAKLVSNFLALGTATLVVEAFRQADLLGVDWAKLYELAQLGSGNSMSLKRIIGQALEGNFDGYVFTVQNTLKDLSAFCALATSNGAVPDLAPALKDIYARAVGEGHGSRMLSALLDPDLGNVT